MNLQNALNRLPARLISKFNAMTDDERQSIQTAWKRHCRACKKSNCAPDGLWLIEAVYETDAHRNILEFM